MSFSVFKALQLIWRSGTRCVHYRYLIVKSVAVILLRDRTPGWDSGSCNCHQDAPGSYIPLSKLKANLVPQLHVSECISPIALTPPWGWRTVNVIAPTSEMSQQAKQNCIPRIVPYAVCKSVVFYRPITFIPKVKKILQNHTFTADYTTWAMDWIGWNRIILIY